MNTNRTDCLLCEAPLEEDSPKCKKPEIQPTPIGRISGNPELTRTGHNTALKIVVGRRTATLERGAEFWKIEYRDCKGRSHFPASYGFGCKVNPERVREALVLLEASSVRLRRETLERSA